jgi:hypothetical protein
VLASGRMCMRQQNKHCLDALVVLSDALMANSARHIFRGEFVCVSDDEREKCTVKTAPLPLFVLCPISFLRVAECFEIFVQCAIRCRETAHSNQNYVYLIFPYVFRFILRYTAVHTLLRSSVFRIPCCAHSCWKEDKYYFFTSLFIAIIQIIKGIDAMSVFKWLRCETLSIKISLQNKTFQVNIFVKQQTCWLSIVRTFEHNQQSSFIAATVLEILVKTFGFGLFPSARI